MNGPKAEKVEKMFDSIAGDYDKLNHILSLNIDKLWRRKAVREIADKSRRQDILDIACGTGDFSLTLSSKLNPASRILGIDLSEGMLEIMRAKVAAKGLSGIIGTKLGNCEHLELESDSRDAVCIGFGIRNFEHREAALTEILRVLKPGGKLVILELSIPEIPLIRGLYTFYFTKILPFVGGLVSKDKAAYSYLPASVLAFPKKKEWVATMENCGFCEVRHEALSLGICRMYVAKKRLV